MRHVAPWLAVVALVLAYPVATLATAGAPTFPARDDCAQPVASDGEVDAVFGYFDDELEAAELRDRALAVGFTGTELAWDGCGRVRVALAGIPTLEVGHAFAEQAREAGFDVTLEQSD